VSFAFCSIFGLESGWEKRLIKREEGMSYRPKGKHVQIDPSNPKALGICDYTGFVFNRNDLVRQMEWRGNALVWTGFYVGKPYIDKPNEQLRPPILPPDPVPVKEPRLPQGSTETFSNNTLPFFSQITLPFNMLGNNEDGALAPTEAERLALLQQGYPPPLVANGGPFFNEQPLTQAQIIKSLNNTRWISA